MFRVDELRSFRVLYAAEYPSDGILAKRAVEHAIPGSTVFYVNAGYEVLDYLQGLGRYSDRLAYPPPRVFLIDVNLFDCTASELLAYIHDHHLLQGVPAVVLKEHSPTRRIEAALAAHYAVIEKDLTFNSLVTKLGSLAAELIRK